MQAGLIARPSIGLTDSITSLVTNLDNAFTLVGIAGDNGASIRYATLVKVGSATAGYQVTSGKTLKIYAAFGHKHTGSATVHYNIGYGDDDAGQQASSAPTAFTVPGANFSTTFANSRATITLPASAGSFYSYMLGGYEVPATKYPAIQSQGVAHVTQMYFIVEEV